MMRMSYEAALNIEIDKELDRLGELKQEWRANFVAHAICQKHTEGLAEGEHKDFWLHCGYDKTRAAVTRRINKRAGIKTDEGDEAQPRLPGYEHMHPYYVVRRNGDDVGVHVDEMTDEEIDKKIASIERMGRSNFDHAREFKRYKRERAAARKAQQKGKAA
jgi:hypothetical protein